MARRALRWGHRCLFFAALGSLCLAGIAHGAALDQQGDINLGVRAYTAARIGTQDTDVKICNLIGGKTVCGGSNGAPGSLAPPPARVVKKSLTFPISPAGHLRQQRSYIEAELDHNLGRLLQDGFGPQKQLLMLHFLFAKTEQRPQMGAVHVPVLLGEPSQVDGDEFLVVAKQVDVAEGA